MSGGYLFGITDRIVKWLASAAVHEIGSLWGLEKELQELEDTLTTVEAVLLDAEEQYVHNRQVKDWLERLEDAVFKADDVLDEFSSEVLRYQVNMSGHNKVAKKVTTFFSTSNQIFFRHKMANKISGIRKMLDKIAADRRDFHFQVLSIEQTKNVSSERDTHSFVVEDNVIGRDGDKMAILELLLETKSEIEENVLVIPIVGIGGLGKTTLAQLVFNDDKVQQHFDMRLWVCVANDFDVKLLVEKIIKSATNTSPDENLEMGQLQIILHKEINRKRYLLILDDVWNESYEKWQRLKDLLVNGAKGSRVIVTSRSENVAKIAAGTTKPYHLESLDPDKCWSLFKKLAFERGQESKDPRIVEMGRKIVEKCGGVPLAIIAVGRMLYFKNPETEWSSFVEKELTKISQNEDSMVLQTLKLSYDHLPSHLKNCFAYCSLFPKYHKIDVKTLINLWMAQGFIKSSDSSECLDELGHVYFMELLSRSFFQEDRRDDVFGDIITCKMHDLMHDLAIAIAGAKCIMLGLNKGTVDRKARHLSFDFNLYSQDQIPASWTQAKRIRSILLPCQSMFMTEARFAKLVCNVILSNFKFLRMLDFNNFGIQVVPECIGDLKHLRYLDLSGNRSLRALPNSVIKLVNLQTLKLNYCYNLEELPRDIKNLVNLKHLEIYGYNKLTYMPSGLGELTNLQTLSQFVLSKDISCVADHTSELNELVGLNNLRGRLEIRNLTHGMDFKYASFKDKRHLQSLILFWDNSHLDVDATEAVDHVKTLEGFRLMSYLKEMRLEYYRGSSLPSWFPSSFTNLVIFELLYCVKCQNLRWLDQFHSLKILKLAHMPVLEYIMDDIDSSSISVMPSLRNVELFDLPELKSWWRNAAISDEDGGVLSIAVNKLWPSFPCLSHLSIDYCPKLDSMPLYPHVEECLKLTDSSLKPFQQSLMNVTTLPVCSKTIEKASSSSPVLTPFSPLSKLRTLFLGRSEDLEYLPDWIKSLTSLKELNIRNCTGLRFLSPGLQLLPSLQILEIRNCKELDISNGNAIMWQALRSLRSLSFFKLPKLVTLPDELQHVTTLQRISIWSCYNFMAMPNWIRSLGSLTTLAIWECPNLTSLPEAMQSMSCLETLSIHDCHTLMKRCQREIGEDWPKIAHIPHLDLRSSSFTDDPRSSNSSSARKRNIFNNFQRLQLCQKWPTS